MLRTVEICLRRSKLNPDVCGLIMEFYYCPSPIAVFRNNMLEYRFKNRTYDTEGENDLEWPHLSVALPINMLASMKNRSIQFTAARNILSIQDHQSCLKNQIVFPSNINSVFGSGNLTVVAIDDLNDRHYNHVSMIDTRNICEMRPITAVIMPRREVLRFMHNGKIITTRDRNLIIYDLHFNPIAMISDLYSLHNFALINNRIVAQRSQYRRRIIYFTYYAVDLDNLTIVEINADEVNEGETHMPASPHSSDDDTDYDDELMQQ